MERENMYNRGIPQGVHRQNVPRQNVPRIKTSLDKASQDIRSLRQNVPRDKTSQGKKRPKEKTSQGTRRPWGQTSFYNVPEISRSARGKVQSKTNIFHGFLLYYTAGGTRRAVCTLPSGAVGWPGMTNGWPSVASAADTPDSSFGAACRPRTTHGRWSAQVVAAPLARRASLI